VALLNQAEHLPVDLHRKLTHGVNKDILSEAVE
jgi:hypothetical protein